MKITYTRVDTIMVDLAIEDMEDMEDMEIMEIMVLMIMD